MPVVSSSAEPPKPARKRRKKKAKVKVKSLEEVDDVLMPEDVFGDVLGGIEPTALLGPDLSSVFNDLVSSTGDLVDVLGDLSDLDPVHDLPPPPPSPPPCQG